MSRRRIERIMVLGTLFLFVGVIADQSMCFSCPMELPADASISDIDNADSDAPCVLCASRLTRPVEREPFVLQAACAETPSLERLCERLVADPIYHPPRR